MPYRTKIGELEEFVFYSLTPLGRGFLGSYGSFEEDSLDEGTLGPSILRYLSIKPREMDLLHRRFYFHGGEDKVNRVLYDLIERGLVEVDLSRIENW